MRRRRIATLFAALGVAAMVACGGSDETAPDGEDAASVDDGDAADATSGSDDGGGPDATVADAADATAPDVDVDAADASAPDSSALDTSAPDTGVPDAHLPDANVADGHGSDGSDANVADVVLPDANVADADVPDVHLTDADVPDVRDAATKPDAAFVDGGVVVSCDPPPAASPPTALSGRVFGAYSFMAPALTVYDITSPDGGAPPVFADVNAGGWLGPMVVTTAGKFYVATHASSGSVFEISAGGDQTGAAPLASGLFPGGTLGEIDAMARDANGNLYVTNSGLGLQSIAVVSPAGAVSYLPRKYDNPEGVVVCGGVLVITEGNAGTVLAHDLTTHRETVWASGFDARNDHVSAQLAVDHRGHLLVLWSASTGSSTRGLYDVTGGGDFSAQVPLSIAPFRIDVNGIATNTANDVFAAGDGDGNTYVARFNAGAYAPFVVYATGLTDTESVVVGP